MHGLTGIQRAFDAGYYQSGHMINPDIELKAVKDPLIGIQKAIWYRYIINMTSVGLYSHSLGYCSAYRKHFGT